MRKLTLSLAVMAALLPLRGYSLGLGDLELHSALNQELNAEIEVLSAVSEDAEKILIKLADRDAFNRAGLDRPFLLQQLKFKIIDKNGVPYVKVYTKTPVSEPFLSFLLEIDWPQGHLLREYTLLLDPPVYNNTAGTPAASNSSPFEEPADAQAQTQPVSPEQQYAQPVYQGGSQATSGMQSGVISSDSGRSVNYEYQTQALPVANAATGQYRVQANDTLWGIANRMRPDSSISVEQMMLALVRKNPEAFIRENINGVKRGYILRMPERDAITQLDRQQAVAQAREHSALWREYSQNAATSSPASAMEMDAMDGGSAADQHRDADGHLSIVGAGEGSEHTGSNQDPDSQLSKLKQELAMANEQLESERLEKEDLRSRLAELEQRVKSVIDGGGGVEMNDSELAKLQEDLQGTQQGTDTANAETPSESVPDDVITDADAAPDELAANDEMNDGMASDEMAHAEMPDESMPMDDAEGEAAQPATEDAVFVDEDPAVTDDIAEAQAPPVQSPEPVKAIAPPAFAQQEPKGFVENLMDDPKLLGMIGGGIAFILLLIALLLKRIRSSKEEDEWTAGMADPSLDSDQETATDFSSISGAELDDATVQTEALDMNQTAEMSVDVDDDDTTRIKIPEADDSLEDTVFSLDADEPEAEEDERDDVIAEAGVYLAYGIYQQAEELLNNAIDQNPERDDYRMKLLETHYAAKNVPAFEELAADVQTRKGDDKSYWDRVVVMGMELAPANDLFSGAGAVIGDFDTDALLPDKPQSTDLELDAGDDFDLGLDTDPDALELDNTELDIDDEDMDLSGLDDTQINPEPENLDAAAAEMDLAGDLDDITNELDAGDTASESEDTSADLEFDLGELDDDEDVVVSDSADEDATEMDIDDDFSLDFDAADLGFEEPEDEAKEDTSLDTDLDLGDELDDDEAVEIDLSDDIGGVDDTSIDNGELDMDLGDLDSDDMDMDDLDLGDVDALDDSATVGDDDEEFDISELSEEVDEVSTKLDLAKAYLDMKNNDEARNILKEVIAEGNDEQKKLADELMQQAD